MKQSEFLRLGIKATRRAEKIILENFRKIQKVDYKGRVSIVTIADTESEKIIRGLIREKFPEHNILGEEEGIFERKSDYCWIIDPLDGTNNYVSGISYFGVSIGLTYMKKPIMGLCMIHSERRCFILKGEGEHS
jgi:myo-inositol-1(or 4)-monophosphatase